jgi:hypothetical protein
MQSKTYKALIELEEHVELDSRLSSMERIQRTEALTFHREIIGHEDVDSRKIQIVRSADGGQSFAVAFSGNKKTQDLFTQRQRDRNGLNSLEDLAKMLEEAFPFK